MRAIVYTELNAITLQDLPVPDVGDHDVLVRTRASGICQTDVEVLKGHYGNSTFPLVPGHEYAGEIVAVGSAVTDYAVDDRVVVGLRGIQRGQYLESCADRSNAL